MSASTASKTQQTCTFVEIDARRNENDPAETAKQESLWSDGSENEWRAEHREKNQGCTIIEINLRPCEEQAHNEQDCGGQACHERPCGKQPDKPRPQSRRSCDEQTDKSRPQNRQPGSEQPRGAHARPAQAAEKSSSAGEDQTTWPEDNRARLPRHARGAGEAAAPQAEGALAMPDVKASNAISQVNGTARLAAFRARVAAALRGAWRDMQGIEYETTKGDRVFGAACGVFFAALSFAVAAL